MMLAFSGVILVMAAIDALGGHYAEATFSVAVVILWRQPRG